MPSTSHGQSLTTDTVPPEPDGLANLITNLGVPKCANAEEALRECTIYAWEALALPNVAIYVDAGHAGWLGWPDNLEPTATLYGELYRAAGSPKAVRGLVTNVSNFNAYRLANPPNYTSPNPNYDESRCSTAGTAPAPVNAAGTLRAHCS